MRISKIKINKSWILILISVISFSAIFIIMLDVVAPQRRFSTYAFLHNMATSIPFTILISVTDYLLVKQLNSSKWLAKNMICRIIIEAFALITLALAFVILGNLILLDERSSLFSYLSSTNFYVSASVTILINIFAVTTIEFFFQVRRNETLQKENLHMQYLQLKNQINPHFLFNSLNVLNSLIHKDSDRASQYIQKLSQIYRYVLTQDTKELVYVAEEMEFINTYIEVLRIRYGDALRCVVSISDDTLGLLIPPMSLQLLIENAVKHNSVSMNKPLTITIKNEGEDLIISNNINPRITVENSTEIGIKNLDRKYNIISGQSIIVDNNNRDFKVTLPLL